MNIEHLRYMIEVDRAGSISQAAENLYMAQPNLSKAIKELEQALNITIFRRTSKGAHITPKGREFLRYAKSILRQYEEMEALGRKEESAPQTLSVSVPRASYIVDAFTSFLIKLDWEKSIDLDFMETNALRAIHHVADGRSALGIIRLRSEYKNYFMSLLEENNLKGETLLEFVYLLLISKDHPLAAKDHVTLNELEPFIEILHGDTALPHIQSATESERGRTPGDKKVHVYERGSQFDILSRAHGSFMWVSPMPEDLLTRNALIQKPCAGSPDFMDILIYPDCHQFTPFESLFLSELDDTVKTILRDTARIYGQDCPANT